MGQRVPRKEAALAEEPDEQHEVKRDAHKPGREESDGKKRRRPARYDERDGDEQA